LGGTNDETNDQYGTIASTLRGKTLRVYWFILRNPKSASLREIQNGANLSSPSLATYHLDKLIELDLVKKDAHGFFHLRRDVKVGVLRLFMGSGRLLIPRFLCYAVFYSAMLPMFLLFIPFIFGPITLLLMFTLIFGAVTNWIETIKAWRMEI
jgi:hypothetical protein